MPTFRGESFTGLSRLISVISYQLSVISEQLERGYRGLGKFQPNAPLPHYPITPHTPSPHTPLPNSYDRYYHRL
ncbi:MAG: hypothetical protein DWQ51_16775 [Microcystis wesenbergii TW10]|uniref:Uncharacterized protein n=2 Tax=Microcystis TaxID=1125 RepID=A0A552ACB6_MICAE|nr:MAG: hypothetical protein DWQ51_16775 [Microcystis wesenbergii TW10]TRT83112.1 MAG: hypothetical protein EWV63_18140 [Microcystis aeruginosa Ma_OC_H_19870700_S124]